MPLIPPTVLKKLYVKGSLRREDEGFAFDLKNLIAPATITSLEGLEVDGEQVDGSRVTIVPPSGNARPIERISSARPLNFPVGVVVTLHVSGETLEPGKHDLALRVNVKEIGWLDIPVSDRIA
ncbi:MAG: hydroxymethylglutaryl-CoA reductase [Anaerolineae bacterium]|nr:hydroxymethylglutaryl-CoA reductase [Chloroflexota bacterium]